jgi:hypothetical protein
MPHWEFLIQRENDRAWRPLTSRKLEIFEGNYRIIANTSMSNSAVHTQIFYQNHEQPPQLAQDHAQQISNEGLLVVMPFTHVQLGTWHLNCNVTITKESGVEEQLCLQVVPRPETDEQETTPPAVEKNTDGLEDRSKPTVTVIHDHYPMVVSDVHPEKLIASSLANLDHLLTEIVPIVAQPMLMSHELATTTSTTSPYPEFIEFPEEDVLDLSVLPVNQVFQPPDPFATVLQIALPPPEQIPVEKLTIEDDQFTDMSVVTDLQFSELFPQKLLIDSYDRHSYEVVVED